MKIKLRGRFSDYSRQSLMAGGMAAVSFLSLLLGAMTKDWKHDFTSSSFVALLCLYLGTHVLRLIRLSILTKRFLPKWKDLFVAHFGGGLLGVLLSVFVGSVARVFFLTAVTASVQRSMVLVFIERLLDVIALGLLFWVLIPLLPIAFSTYDSLYLFLVVTILCLSIIGWGAFMVVKIVSRIAVRDIESDKAIFLLRHVQILRRALKVFNTTLGGRVFPLTLITIGIWAIETFVASYVLIGDEITFFLGSFTHAFASVISFSNQNGELFQQLGQLGLGAGAFVSFLILTISLCTGRQIGTKYIPSLTPNTVLIYNALPQVPYDLVGLASVPLFSQVYCLNGTTKDDFFRKVKGVVKDKRCIVIENKETQLKEIFDCDHSVFLYVSSEIYLTRPEVFERLFESAPMFEGCYCDAECKVAITTSANDVINLVDGKSISCQGGISLEKFAKDLNSRDALGWLLSSNTAPRHFNKLTTAGELFVKSSVDKQKIFAEYSLYGLLPQSMKSWFVEPFDYKETDDVARYSMKRIRLPNVSSVWVQGGFNAEEYEKLLECAFEFVNKRVSRTSTQQEVGKSRKSLYIDKVVDRYEQLREWEFYPHLENVFLASSGETIVSLYERYFDLYKRIEKETVSKELCIGHGDLCFSNMMYDSRDVRLFLVDPKGATNKENMFMDAYYDVCKLSHSALGLYDFINMHRCDVVFSNDLSGELVRTMSLQPWTKDIFRNFLIQNGFSWSFVRIGEASLFLSMVPLHVDYPLKVLSFLMTASRIIKELEEQK